MSQIKHTPGPRAIRCQCADRLDVAQHTRECPRNPKNDLLAVLERLLAATELLWGEHECDGGFACDAAVAAMNEAGRAIANARGDK